MSAYSYVLRSELILKVSNMRGHLVTIFNPVPIILRLKGTPGA